ncbi:MAG: hypothetical protein OXG33_10615 [Chloroflexi bacterium]|nr:hypothetical protein [Chloroflexota bacterium]
MLPANCESHALVVAEAEAHALQLGAYVDPSPRARSLKLYDVLHVRPDTL